MPLAFDSLSHSTVAFGYFNIDTDLLLLEQLFFFTPEFCALVEAIAAHDAGEARFALPGYEIPRAEVGDLMGAIHGVRFTGFIGESYRRWPFPDDPQGFRQQPEGYRQRAAVEEMLGRWARPRSLPVQLDAAGDVAIDTIRFSRAGFTALIAYVWRGGYPRWRDGQRPAEVRRLAGLLDGRQRGFLAGFGLQDPSE